MKMEAQKTEAWNLPCYYVNMQITFLFIFTQSKINLLKRTVLFVTDPFRETIFWAITVRSPIRKQQPFIRPFIPSSVQYTHINTHTHRQPRCLNSEKHYFDSPTEKHQIHWLSSQAGEERILQMGHVNFPNCVLCKSAHIICSYVRLFQIRNHCRQTNHTAHEKQKVRNYFSPLWITKFSHLGRTQSIRAWKLSLLFRTDNYSR